MYSSIVHIAVGSSPSSWRVSAPGRAPARDVLDALLAAADAPRSVFGDLSGSTGDETWAEWSSRHPTVCAADGLPFSSTEQSDAASAALYVRRGPDSGFFVRVPRGVWTCGRGSTDIPLADPFLSRSGVSILSTPRSLTIDGARLSGGAARLGSLELAEPPRPARPAVHAEAWPRRENPESPQSPTWIAFAAPILLGIVLASVMRMWWFLLFSASTPLTAWLTWRMGLRRHHRDLTAADRAHRSRGLEIAEMLRAAVADCIVGVESAAVDAPLIRLGRGRVVLPVSVSFPDGRPTAAAADPLRAGHVREAVRPECDPADVLPTSCSLASCRTPARGDGERHLVADDAPVTIDEGTPLDVIGPPETVDGILRSIAHQLIARRTALAWAGPSAPPPELRGWVRRGFAAHDDGVVLALHRRGHSATLQVRTCSAPDSAPVIRIDATAEPQLERPDGLPSSVPGSGAPVPGRVELHTVSRASFIRLCRDQRATAEPAADDDRAPDLADLLTSAESDGLRAPIGAAHLPAGACRGDERGDPVCIDLLSDGPHALVAGTTGSGKSVLLQSWITGLMATHSPESLRFILLDFKGGAAFSPFAAAAHTDAVLSDLDSAGAARAIRAIRAEVTRRERLLAEADAEDICAFNRSAHAPLPRLVIVIDEFHIIAAADSTCVEAVEALTALGRSLGIHVILATQRPAGVITARMRANISLRVCLRVRDESESRDVIEIPDAAHISAASPGTAILSSARGAVRFRCAIPHADQPEIVVHRLDDVGRAQFSAESAVTVPLALAGIPPISRGGPRHAVVRPPLPEVLTGGAPTALGLVDRPDLCDQPTWSLGDADSILVTGGRGRGRSTALARIAEAAVAAGETVIALSPAGAAAVRDAPGMPHVDDRGLLVVDSDAQWALDFLIDESLRHPAATRWIIDDWERLCAEPPAADRMRRLEAALVSGQCGSFAVGADRRILSQPIAAHASSRLVLPTAEPDDAVYFGLPRGRFAGDAPPGRAVLRAPKVTEHRVGSDVQIAMPSAPLLTAPSSSRTHPLWQGFSAPPRRSPLAGDSAPSGPLLGTSPTGEEIRWSGDRGARVLAVRAPDTAAVRAQIDSWADQAGGCPVITDPSGDDAELLADVLSTGRVAVVALPYQRLGRASQFDRGNEFGPVVLIDAQSGAELACSGRRDLAPLPPTAESAGPTRTDPVRTAWVCTHTRTVPIAVC